MRLASINERLDEIKHVLLIRHTDVHLARCIFLVLLQVVQAVLSTELFLYQLIGLWL